jgi:hypothetical protein
VSWLLAFLRYPLGPDWRLRKAAKVLSDARIRREREAIRAKARQLCIESNQPIPRALRG